jgi:hypothetical protein
MSWYDEQVVRLYPDDLLRKFGFGDGDLFFYLVEDLELGVDDRDLLFETVRRLLLPRLDQEVEVYTIVSLHNPVRALTIDGEQASIHSDLTPEWVEIPIEEVVRLASTLPPTED